MTVGGQQRVEGCPDIPVAARVFGTSSVTTIDRDCIEAGGEQVVEAVLDSSRRGIRNFVADAANDRHLATLAEVASVVEEDDVDLVTVSPGAWLKYHPARVISRPRFVLVVLSSATDQNHRQLERLVATMPCHVLDPSRATSDPVPLPEGNGDDSAGGRARDDHVAQRRGRRRRLALDGGRQVGRHRLGQRPPMPDCGASAWWSAAGSRRPVWSSELAGAGLRATAEADPLCGAGTLLGGGWDGLALITKGGLVGDDSTLSRLVTTLWDGWPNG